MSIENMMCSPLYSDMASVTLGLYENKDEYLPYALFVVGIDEHEILVFTSEERIGKNKKTKHYKEWVKSNPNVQEVVLQPTLRYEPYIASYSLPDSAQAYDDTFFNKLFDIPQMDLVFRWPVYKDRVFIMLYKDHALTAKTLPKLMFSACETTFMAWYEYFKSDLYVKSPPIIDIKKIIETLDDFKDMAPFFETVTKISSLFYEKTRSKGSIAVMRNSDDPPLVQFRTDSIAETLTFSIEHTKQLRKLLETTKEGLSLLVHEGKVYGIGEPTQLKCLYMFYITGQLEWHVLNHSEESKGIQVLRYKHGEYYLPTDAEIRRWYIRSKIKDTYARRVIEHLLEDKYMKAFDHGALLIVTAQAKSEVKRLCERKRGLRTEKISTGSNFEKASALCAIDGALFLDKEGDCHGIGIILDGEAIVNGTPARGSRYNSTKTYISRCVANDIDAYAIIMSTDGYLDILTSDDEEFIPIREARNKENVG